MGRGGPNMMEKTEPKPTLSPSAAPFRAPTCVESTSSRAAMRNRSTEGSALLMYSSPAALAAAAAAISSSSTMALHLRMRSEVVFRISSTAASAFCWRGTSLHRKGIWTAVQQHSSTAGGRDTQVKTHF